MVKTELYFGLNISGTKKSVTEKELQSFLNVHVMPKFPNGFTVLRGQGRFQMDNGTIVSEPSFILVIVHDGFPRSSKNIDYLRGTYKGLFAQQSVMRVDYSVEVSF